MTRKRRPRPRRMSSILDGLGSRDCFATDMDWLDYQVLLEKLRMYTLEQQKDGKKTIRPAQGHRNIAARVER